MHFFPRLIVAPLLLLYPVCSASAQQLNCNPCSHAYGRVLVGTAKTYAFQLTNTGTKALHILSKSKTGSGFSFVTFPLPLTLKQGATVQMTVKFSPSVAGKATGTLQLLSDAKNPNLSLGVQGMGVASEGATLTVSPASLDFGTVAVGATGTLSLKLSAANGPVTVSSVESSTSEFTTPGLTLPLAIAQGKSASIAVAFTPAVGGTAVANLTVGSNATNSPASVPLTGVGATAGSHETDLSWNPSSGVIGYNIYRGGQHGGPYNRMNGALESSTNYSDTTVLAGMSYYYVVTAVDSGNTESGYSNEVKVVIPTP